jgi:Protein of unknown function (DUF2459)
MARHASRALSVVALLLTGCASVPPPAALRPGMAYVYVVRRSWHVDVGFAREALQPPLTRLADPFPGTRFLLVGFGDRHYLLAKHHGPSTLLAAVWPGPGMILTTALKGTPQQAFDEKGVIEIALTAQQLMSLQQFIWASVTNTGAPEDLGPGPYPGSRYYASPLRYSGVHTCNTWAAEALEAGGLPVHASSVVLASQVWAQVERIARARAGGHEPGALATGVP